VVADALSHKHYCNNLMVQPLTSCSDPTKPSLRVIPHGTLTNIAPIPTIMEYVIATQRMDVGMGHLVVPKDFELRRKIMYEAHCYRYSIHSGTNKMYQDLKKSFWWTRMKREIVKYMAECDKC
jgi:hypothetical protein